MSKGLLKRQQSFANNDTALYSHKGLGGDVYVLPQDGMPCLRPDTIRYVYNEPKVILKRTQPFTLKDGTKLIMPVPASGNTMPNAYQGKQLVWEKKP